MKNQKSFSARRLVVAGMLAAMIVMLDVTGIGMLNIGLGAAVTLFSLPVLVGVMAEGLSVGLLMGGAFGVISFARAFSSPEPLAPLFMNPLVSIAPRLLIPVVAWLVLKAMHPLVSQGGKKRALARGIAALAGSLTNTVLVLSMAFLMVLLGTAMVLLNASVGVLKYAVGPCTGEGAAAKGKSVTVRNEGPGEPSCPALAGHGDGLVDSDHVDPVLALHGEGRFAGPGTHLKERLSGAWLEELVEALLVGGVERLAVQSVQHTHPLVRGGLCVDRGEAVHGPVHHASGLRETGVTGAGQNRSRSSSVCKAVSSRAGVTRSGYTSLRATSQAAFGLRHACRPTTPREKLWPHDGVE